MFDEREARPGRLFLFRVGAGHFGISLDQVFGVREATDPECRTASGKRTVFRGAEIEVLDPRAWGWGGAEAREGTPPGCHLVIGRGEERVALLVDAAEGLLEAPTIIGLPAWIVTLTGAGVSGVVLQAGGALLVVDPEAVLSRRLGGVG